MRPGCTTPRLMIAGVSGNVGKTTVTTALIAALKARGLKVACFKCGPDYLDPTYHQTANGEPSHNLDTWMMGGEAVLRTFHQVAEDADIALIEGMMGLFDGLDPTSSAGSSADLAKRLRAPVLLVADTAASARSIAAVALGFKNFDPELEFAGLFCNFIGSIGHLNLMRRAKPVLPILGGLPRGDRHQFSERHLGLEAAHQNNLGEEALRYWADQLNEHTDLDRILSAAGKTALEIPGPERAGRTAPGSVRIAVARDQAFSFYYQDNLSRLEEAGAELIFFSPCHDQRLPDADLIYLGGGYPELHAQLLADNRAIRHGIRDFADKGGFVYGECGGFMYLTQAIVDMEGRNHEMCGVLRGKAVMCNRLQEIGYGEITTNRKTLLGEAGTKFRGHQFRYSNYQCEGTVPTAFDLHKRRRGAETVDGYYRDNILAGYVHAHWASNPGIPVNIVRALLAARG